MKFFILASIASAIPNIYASGNLANFAASCNVATGHMSSFSANINAVSAIARRLGHQDILSKCGEASNHLNTAMTAWGGISSGFGSQPWTARRSPHASTVQGSLGACGVSMNWIYGCKNFKHPAYKGFGDKCRGNYDSCQSSCGQVWNWPSPPRPQPSGAYGGSYSKSVKPRSLRSETLRCPIGETACPISSSTVSIECLDLKREISSCGGCTSLGQGENCLTIHGAAGVGCHLGKCVVLSTLPDYFLGKDGRPVSLLPLHV